MNEFKYEVLVRIENNEECNQACQCMHRLEPGQYYCSFCQCSFDGKHRIGGCIVNFSIQNKLELPKTLYTIECRTGCTCCSSENFSFGFFLSKEDAQRRIDRFLRGVDYPLASQYAKHGRYDINEHAIEYIEGNRMIVDDDTVYNIPEFITTDEEGFYLTGEEVRLDY